MPLEILPLATVLVSSFMPAVAMAPLPILLLTGFAFAVRRLIHMTNYKDLRFGAGCLRRA